MSKNNIADLLERYQRGECTPEEKARVDQWFEAHEMAETRFEQMTANEQENWVSALFADIQQANQPKPTTIYRKLYPYIAAASVILILGSGLLFFKLKSLPPPSGDVSPYTAKAILKTGHGKTLILDSNRKGTLAQYANTHIQKTSDDRIVYTNNQETEINAIFDTLQVPAGGKPYHLKLADGSVIIVNVASTLRFPENFRKNNNEVELISGEAYFNIIHDAQAPLIIKAKGQTIEDIGTEFNVNTYHDEPDSRTTLVEGAVKVNRKLLAPGQQAILRGSTLMIAKADVEQITSWKNGYFRFNGEDIQTVMRELARWYNIEVRYEGKISKEGYYVKISRSKNISEVLKALERTNSVHFKIEGTTPTVLHKP
jgi:transmembrane sensor